MTATVQGSLYTTAQRFNIPSKLVRQMTTIFNKEIDFSRSLRSGDQFSIIYDAYYIEDKMVGVGDILVVTYTNRGKLIKQYVILTLMVSKTILPHKAPALKKPSLDIQLNLAI